MKKRLRRRVDLHRMKARAKWIYRDRWGLGENPNNIKLANHIAHCSLSCCGNPRRWFGEKTMQERRFECAEQD